MIELKIDNNTCIRCGRCVAVCPVSILTQEEKKGEIGIVNLQRCIDCGQCVAICPTQSVDHSSYPAQKVHPVRKELLPSPEALLEIMRRRRSNRTFSGKEVPMDYLDKILEAADLAPTAKNYRPLRFTLVTRPDVLKAVHKACIEVCDQLADRLLAAEDKEAKKRGLYFKALSTKYKGGYEIILRYAKALIIIHADEESAAPDANLAYQNASLMAEALDVAHFYTGYVRILCMLDVEGIIKKTMGIEGKVLAGMALGMPKYTFNNYIDRKEQRITKLI